MKWKNAKLIFFRELRDQLRDRRTLFTVAVLPILLYPLLGMAMLQVSQFMREYPARVWLVGADQLQANPSFLIDGKINPDLTNDQESSLLEIQLTEKLGDQWESLFAKKDSKQETDDLSTQFNTRIQQEMAERKVDLAVFFAETQPDSKIDSKTNPAISSLPQILLFHNSASDKSQIGVERFSRVLKRWNSTHLDHLLKKYDVPRSLAFGLQINKTDVALKSKKRAALWSKILPFIIVIWSLTGAFYPAIDLCAGEKERGTFETLLSSPAARSEIAIGKLLTVMSFSATTSLLNLLSMGFTGMFVISKMSGSIGHSLPVGFPPLECFLWLLLALIPISALFSAIALATASFARSSKEGQYYLVPLMMITMPLMMIPMLPASKLDLGTSLIPVSGLMLLLRGLIEGEFTECLPFIGPVVIVTLACCWMAVRWVVYMFNSETVLFRASERFNLGMWFRHVIRDRHQLPSLGNAILCVLLILVAKFFIGFVAVAPESFAGFAKQTVIILVATIAFPAIVMAMLLTRNPFASLRLRMCSAPVACAAVLAAICLNPLITWITALVMQIYPPGENLALLEQAVSKIMSDAPGMWAIVLVFALAPALTEELAFRGFILSGLESLKSKWQAILLSSLAFGIAHSVIQQSLITFVVGIVIGIIAIQSRSLIPCVLFHFVHNSMAVLMTSLKPETIESSLILNQILVTSDGHSYQYGVLPGILMATIGIGLIVWFLRLPNAKPDQQHENWQSDCNNLTMKNPVST